MQVHRHSQSVYSLDRELFWQWYKPELETPRSEAKVYTPNEVRSYCLATGQRCSVFPGTPS